MSKRLKIDKGLHVEKKYMEWEIDVQSLIKSDRNRTLYTEKFSFMNKDWSLEISTRHYGHSWISVFLNAANGEAAALFESFTFTLGIKYLERDINRDTTAEPNICHDGWSKGYRQFCSIKKFLELSDKTPNLPLTVYCYLECHNTKQLAVDAESQTLMCSTITLSHDFQDLLSSGRHSDVTIKVLGREFKAHKSILGTRSSFFATVFGNDRSNQSDGVVCIDDCDPDVFYNFLQYIYTGELKYISSDYLIGLYTAAAKFSVADLKQTCVQIMTEEISVVNACDFLVLADKHSEVELKNCVKEFLIKNMKETLPTTSWMSFMSKHSSMAQDILLKAFSGTTDLCHDFGDLFASGLQSDIIINVHDQKFKVHKSIIVARSPVFAAMFIHDMSEKEDGIVHIDDCDPNAFHHFLHYMYTGNLKYVSPDNLTSLYTLADKYGVTDLKETCVQFMKEDLSVNNACDFLILADKHNETDLKNFIEDFIIKNMKRALPTNNWELFMSEHPSMAQSILIRSFNPSVSACLD